MPTSATKAPRTRQRPSDQDILNYYLKRIDPKIAASFTPEQRDAIKSLLGGRDIARHAVEVRRSIGLPSGRRFYMVFLLGRERRGLSRLHDQDDVSPRFNVLFYLGMAGLFFAPILALLYAAGP